MIRTVLVLAVAGSLTVAYGQTPGSPPSSSLAFEVASIKERTTAASGGFAQSPDQFVRINSSLRDLIEYAFGLQRFQIVGGPSWVTVTRYDVNGKAPGVPTSDQMRLMVRRLLEERFQLKVSTTIREMPVYELRMARSDGSFGPQLKRNTADCAAIRAERARGGDAAAARRLSPDAQPLCESRVRGMPGPNGLTVRYQSSGTTSTELATWLSTYAGRVVLDHTGLTSAIDVDLSFAPPGAPTVATDIGAPPTIFTAVTDQLGLRLEASVGRVDVLVIDAAQQPTPD